MLTNNQTNDQKKKMNSKKEGFIVILISLLIMPQLYTIAQGIKGKITNTEGNPVPFVNIYVPSLSTGGVSNMNGIYKIDLEEGTYKVVFQCLGYKTIKKSINIKNNNYTMYDISLSPHSYRMPEVRVYPGDEDPAYRIMRKAIAMSSYYLNQVSSYDCKVYLKGSGKIKNIPGILKNSLKKEGIEEGKRLIIENITQLHYEAPNTMQQEVIAYRSNLPSEEANPMQFITLSLYQEADRQISPLDKRAFSVYDFKLEGSFNDKDRIINKIKVIPKREGYDLYSGYIFIAENYWNIHSAKLKIDQRTFSMKINQMYAPVKDDIWMPVSYDFDVDLSLFGFKMNIFYVASVSDYKLTKNKDLENPIIARIKDNITYVPNIETGNDLDSIQQITTLSEKHKQKIDKLTLDKKLETKEARKINKKIRKEAKRSTKKRSLHLKSNFTIADSAGDKSINYWDSIRPVELTKEEISGYEEKDSLERLLMDTMKRDSVRLQKTRFKIKHLIFGKSYEYDSSDSQLNFPGFLSYNNFSFNTVDGLLLQIRPDFSTEFEKQKIFKYQQYFSYAFSRKRANAYAGLEYNYNGIRRASVRLELGRKTTDFNENCGIHRGINMTTSLAMKKNYLKLYEKDFIKAAHQFDIANGLTLTTKIEYALRRVLVNHSDFTFNNAIARDYSSNIPVNENMDKKQLHDHKACIADAKISYTPRYYYRIRKHKKIMAHSHYPTLTVQMQQGIMEAKKEFTHFSVSLNQAKFLKKLGTIEYAFTWGDFLHADKIFFSDYKHFASNYSYISNNTNGNYFRLLPYYKFSTNQSYLEAHTSLSDDRLLLKRLPLLNKTLLQENIYLNYLTTNQKENYFETGYGLSQVFLLFNLEIFAGFENMKHKTTGIKVVVPIFSDSHKIQM